MPLPNTNECRHEWSRYFCDLFADDQNAPMNCDCVFSVCDLCGTVHYNHQHLGNIMCSPALRIP